MGEVLPFSSPDGRRPKLSFAGLDRSSLRAAEATYQLLQQERRSPGQVVIGSTESVLDSLHPSIRVLAEEHLRRARAEDIPMVLTNGYRSLDEQQRLYDQGRSKPGPIVTNAPPGSSWHNFALAYDVALEDEQGRPSWPNDGPWERMGELGEDVGLEWGGRWSTPDLPHYGYHPGMTQQDALAGMRPEVPTVSRPQTYEERFPTPGGVATAGLPGLPTHLKGPWGIVASLAAGVGLILSAWLIRRVARDVRRL